MLGSKKRIVKILTCLVFIMMAYVVNVFAVVSPTRDFYINDYAGVLSSETKNYILSNSAELGKRTTAQAVVAVIDSLNGEDPEKYTLDLFEKWKIGDDQADNGLLIFLAIQERELRIKTGYGLEGRLNDSKLGRLVDEYAIPFLKNDDWDTGIKTLYSSIISEIYAEYNMEVPEEVTKIVSQCDANSEDSQMSMVIGISIVALIFVFGGLLPLLHRKKPFEFDDFNDPTQGPWWGGFGGGGGGFSSGGGFTGGGGSTGGGGVSRKF